MINKYNYKNNKIMNINKQKVKCVYSLKDNTPWNMKCYEVNLIYQESFKNILYDKI